MSKQGRKEPRWILFMVSKVAIVCNPLIKELYNNYSEKGKSKMCALGIIMHKILRIVYGMLKNNTRFDPEIDRLNRAKHKENSSKKGALTSRRYQALDVKAPISKRQLKKRREASQNSNTIKNGITPPSKTIYNKSILQK